MPSKKDAEKAILDIKGRLAILESYVKGEEDSKPEAAEPGRDKDWDYEGTPTRYQDEWGVRVSKKYGVPQPGDIVKVTAKNGKTWFSVVNNIAKEYDDSIIFWSDRLDDDDKGEKKDKSKYDEEL